MSGASDRAVISTGDDAALAKLSAVRAGYLDDDFASPMSAGAVGLRGGSSRGVAAEPVIRRGTHARVAAVDRCVGAFLSPRSGGGRRQVVVLGAGRDTSYLRRRFAGGGRGAALPPLPPDTGWYEVDHPSVVREKARRWLPRCVPGGHRYQFDEEGGSYAVDIFEDGRGATGDGDGRGGCGYHLVGHDLRDPPHGLFGALSRCGYDPSAPTLFVLECVLMYLPEDSARSLLAGIASSPAAPGSAAVVSYDPVPGGGRFGNLMVDNLRRALGVVAGGRGGGGDGSEAAARLSLEATRTLSDQLGRLEECGFRSAAGCDMMDAYSCGVVPEDERRRAASAEMLDELEEFELLMRHYCLVVGVATDGEGDDDALRLCSVGEDSPVGFREGRCSVIGS